MIDAAKTLEELRNAIAAENADRAQRGEGSRFSVQPVPQSGRGYFARYLVHHSYANGIGISRTEVAIASQITAKHPRFDWQLEGNNWRDLFAAIVDEDASRLERRRRRR